jgi:hypothetical protein
MSNELITIEESTALTAFSKDGGLSPFIEKVRNEVLNFEHDLSNDARRKKTASLAAKVRKVKTRLDKLGKGLTDDWAQKKKAVDANRKAMRDELDEIAKLARKPLDEWEAEQARVEAEKAFFAMLEEAYKMNDDFNEKLEAQKIMDHMQAIIDNNEFDKRKAEEAEQARLLAEKKEKDRIQREKEIAEKAAADAKLKAEQDALAERNRLEAEKQAAIDAAEKAKRDAEAQRKAAIQADIEAEEAREKAAIAAKKAAEDKAKQEAENKRIAKQAEKRRIAEKAEAEKIAEQNRLAAIEQTRREEAQKAADKKKAEDEAAATRKANNMHRAKIKGEIKSQLMVIAGLTEEQAISAVQALVKPYFKHVTINY